MPRSAYSRIRAATWPGSPTRAVPAPPRTRPTRAHRLGPITSYFQKLTPEQRDAWGRCQTCIALGYLLLVLESRGYGSSPLRGFDEAGVKRLLHLPDHAEVAALVAFGRPADSGRMSLRHRVESLVRFA